MYMAEHTVEALAGRIAGSLDPLGAEYEIILVDDGSPDDSWSRIQECCRMSRRVKGLRLSRNFGQHPAITAGLREARGKWIVVLDCDLQDRPEEIPALYAKAMEGYHIVQASRDIRHDSPFRRMASWGYHRIFGAITGLRTRHTVGNFGIYSRQAIDAILAMPELYRQLPAQLEYIGFSRATIPATHDARASGKSSYTLGKLTAITINSMVANSSKPLQWAVGLGFAMSMLSFALAIYNIAARIYGIITLPGYTTTVFSIWFVGGILLTMLGTLGLYIGKIFDQVKGRPPYIIMERINI